MNKSWNGSTHCKFIACKKKKVYGKCCNRTFELHVTPHQDNIPHHTGIGPDEWFYWLEVVLVGSCPSGEWSSGSWSWWIIVGLYFYLVGNCPQWGCPRTWKKAIIAYRPYTIVLFLLFFGHCWSCCPSYKFNTMKRILFPGKQNHRQNLSTLGLNRIYTLMGDSWFPLVPKCTCMITSTICAPYHNLWNYNCKAWRFQPKGLGYFISVVKLVSEGNLDQE